MCDNFCNDDSKSTVPSDDQGEAATVPETGTEPEQDADADQTDVNTDSHIRSIIAGVLKENIVCIYVIATTCGNNLCIIMKKT